MKLKHIITKQYQINPIIGAAKVTYTNTAPYINIYTALSVSAIFWYTSGWKLSVKYIGFSITYPGFMAICLLAGIVFSLIVYKFEMPSSMRFLFDQWFKHSTLLPARLDNIENKLDKLISQQYTLTNNGSYWEIKQSEASCG